MKLCVIAPTFALPLLSLGDMHLTLAHWAVQNQEYADFYYNQSVAYNDYIILDNGAYEHGAADPVDTILKAAELVVPDEIVVPDVIGDCEATLKAVADSFDTLYSEHSLANFMFIPQGKNFAEWIKCLGLLAAEYPIGAIGIPRMQCDVEHTWVQHIAAVNALVNEEIPIHLFGSPRDLTAAACVEAFYPNRVRSTDTAKMVYFAMQDIPFRFPLDSEQRPPHGRPDDFLDATLTPAQIDIATYNIHVMRMAVEDHQFDPKD